MLGSARLGLLDDGVQAFGERGRLVHLQPIAVIAAFPHPVAAGFVEERPTAAIAFLFPDAGDSAAFALALLAVGGGELVGLARGAALGDFEVTATQKVRRGHTHL